MSRKSRTPAVAGPSLRGLWALGFVVMAIIALVAVPIHFDRKMSETRARTSNLLDPAAGLSSDLRLLKARQQIGRAHV